MSRKTGGQALKDRWRTGESHRKGFQGSKALLLAYHRRHLQLCTQTLWKPFLSVPGAVTTWRNEWIQKTVRHLGSSRSRFYKRMVMASRPGHPGRASAQLASSQEKPHTHLRSSWLLLKVLSGVLAAGREGAGSAAVSFFSFSVLQQKENK